MPSAGAGSTEPFSLLEENLESIEKLCTSLKPRIEELERRPTGDGRGISLFDVKIECLLLYLRYLLYLIQLKLNGVSIVKDKNDIVWKLIELRIVLEKAKVLESGLQYQIERLVLLATDALRRKNAGLGDKVVTSGSFLGGKELNNDVSNDGVAGDDDEKDDVLLRPNVEAMIENDDDVIGVNGKNGVYRPPRIAAVEVEESGKRREERERFRLRERARRSANVREMLDEMSGRPEEVFADGLDGGDIEAAMMLRREDKERRTVEEETFRRMAMTRKEKQRRRELENRARGFNDVDGGKNEMLGIMDLADRIGGNIKRGQKEDEVLEGVKRGFIGGDALTRMSEKRKGPVDGGVRKKKKKRWRTSR